MSAKVCLISQNGTVLVDRECLRQTSKVFTNVIDPQEKWLLNDFSHRCLEHLVAFMEEFHGIDCKLPEKIDHHTTTLPNRAIAMFMETKSRHEIMELLFVSNFIEYPLLFHVCCVQIAHWMSRQGGQLHTTPSDEFICRLTRK